MRELFEDLADEVARPRQDEAAQRAWVRAAQVRRRRVVVGAAAALLLLAVPVAMALRPAQQRPQPAAIRTVNADGVLVDRVPADLVGQTPARWPGSVGSPADSRISRVSRATLLYLPSDLGPAYLWGLAANPLDPGMTTPRWFRLDQSFVTAAPVLGPAGRRLAFADDGGYSVLDLATGVVTHTPMVGPNKSVTWLPDGDRLLVTVGPQTYLATPDHVIGPLDGVDAFGLTVPSGAGIVTTVEARGSIHVVRHDGDRASEFDTPSIVGYHIDKVVPRGYGSGLRIAEAAWASTARGQQSVVVVIDEASQAVTHVLELGPATSERDDAVVGWLDEQTVLVDSADRGVLAWHLPTGVVTRALPPMVGRISVAPLTDLQR